MKKKKKFSRKALKVLIYLFGLMSIGSNVITISNTVNRLNELGKVNESEENSNGN